MYIAVSNVNDHSTHFTAFATTSKQNHASNITCEIKHLSPIMKKCGESDHAGVKPMQVIFDK